MTDLISSPANPLVKLIHSLHQKKGRQETGLFLVEGIHPVGQAVEADWNLDTIVFAPDLLTSAYAQQLVEQQALRKVRCVAFTPQLFTSVAGKENPQGILALVHQRHLAIDELNSANFTMGVASVCPQDPGNVGTILRTLDAVGADGLFLLEGGVDLYHPTVVRASMGTLFWKVVIQCDFNEFTLWSRRNGFRLVGSSAHNGIDYREFQWENKPTLLLLGNEQKGLSPLQIAACDQVVTIPMKGRVSSLNLAVAAGILLDRLMENK
jgi:TrmH family RNA methyltransferase